jgi:HPt (histidine-containing phosphotransfer) domain-containing protein
MSTGDLTQQHETLDPGVVRALEEMLGNDPEALAEIVDAFRDEGPQRVAELNEGLSAGDATLVGRAAHTLKANAAMFGAVRLEAFCRELETAARGGDLSGATQLIDVIGAEWLVVEPQLVALRERGSA